MENESADVLITAVHPQWISRVWVTFHSKIRAQNIQLFNFALWHNFHVLRIGLYSKEESGEIRPGHLSWDSPWKQLRVGLALRSSMCVHQCSPASLGGEFPTRVFLRRYADDIFYISNERYVTLRAQISQIIIFFPKTLNSDCLEVIKNPNTHTYKRK